MRLLSVHRRPVFRVARVERAPSKLAVTTGNPILNEALKREGQGNRVTRGCCAKGLRRESRNHGGEKHERRATSDERRATSDERRLRVPTGVTWLYCNSRVFLRSCSLTLPSPPLPSPPLVRSVSPRSSQTQFARKTVSYVSNLPFSPSFPFLRPFCLFFFTFAPLHRTQPRLRPILIPSVSHCFFFSLSPSGVALFCSRKCRILFRLWEIS